MKFNDVTYLSLCGNDVYNYTLSKWKPFDLAVKVMIFCLETCCVCQKISLFTYYDLTILTITAILLSYLTSGRWDKEIQVVLYNDKQDIDCNTPLT